MLASTFLLYVTPKTAKLHLLNPLYLILPPLDTSFPLPIHLQYLNVRLTCQYSNEGVDINP